MIRPSKFPIRYLSQNSSEFENFKAELCLIYSETKNRTSIGGEPSSPRKLIFFMVLRNLY